MPVIELEILAQMPSVSSRLIFVEKITDNKKESQEQTKTESSSSKSWNLSKIRKKNTVPKEDKCAVPVRYYKGGIW